MVKLKKVISAKFNGVHAFWWISGTLIAEGLVVGLIVPALLVFIYGDGITGPGVEHKPVVRFVAGWLPLLITLLILTFYLLENMVRRKYSRAKTFLITGAILILIYPFRGIITMYIGMIFLMFF